MATLSYPLFPLNTVLFPGGPLSLRIFEPRYLSMVSRCMREEHGFGVVLINAGSEVGTAEFATTGTLAEIVDWYQSSDGLLGVLAEGRERFRVTDYEQQSDGLYIGAVELLEPEAAQALETDQSDLANQLEDLLEEAGAPYDRITKHYDDASWVGYRFAEILPLPVSTKQELLELEDARRRLELLRPHVIELTVTNHV